MRNFFQNVTSPFEDVPNAWLAAICRYLAQGGDAFDRPAFLAYLKKSNNHDLLGQYSLPNPDDALPIEFFKDQELLPHFYTNQRSTSKAFRSSGTTSKTQSESPFSDTGLMLYRAAALQSFVAALKHAQKSDGFEHTQGLSLIPSANVWTSSSLAQMMSWFAEEFPVTFIADDYPEQEAGALRTLIAQAKKPLWIFGTAFHFINLFDDGLRVELPPGSFVIETGGTKGRSRSVTRSELFESISAMFSLPQKHILSEYSMSELAAQSWDFGADCEAERRYIFPAWVDVSVLLQNGSIAREGTGALIINDPLRIDLSAPIRTEDIVNLSKDKFQIMRRSNTAPLKGCSLFAERAARPAAIAAQQQAPARQTTLHNAEQRAQLALRVARELLEEPSVVKNFSEECGSGDLGRFTTEDLRSSLPNRYEDLVAGAQRSSIKPGSNWIFLAPANHSLATIHPLLCAFVGGAHIAAKIPDKFLKIGSYLQLLIKTLNAEDPQFFTLLSSDYRIEKKTDLQAGQNILVFGSDDTVEQLATIAPGSISGFGDVTTVAAGDLASIKTYGHEIVRDFFSLRQSGCMSARAFFLEQKNAADLEEAVKILSAAASKFASITTVDDTAALHGEKKRFQTLFSGTKQVVSDHVSGPLVVGITWNNEAITETVTAQKAFTLPIISLPGNGAAFVNNLKSLVLTHLNVGLLLYPADSKIEIELADSTKNLRRHLSFRSFGQAQAPAFNGLHEGRPLFQISC